MHLMLLAVANGISRFTATILAVGRTSMRLTLTEDLRGERAPFVFLRDTDGRVVRPFIPRGFMSFSTFVGEPSDPRFLGEPLGLAFTVELTFVNFSGGVSATSILLSFLPPRHSFCSL